jgi:CRISPR-associated endonuclease Csy4
MDHYLEIRVLPDPEFTTVALLEALFAKLHRALGRAGQGKIGVSFPNAGKTLGDRLRLHGTLAMLTALEAEQWRKGLRDYSECSEILPVPANVKHRRVQRVQIKSNAERLRRRSVRKGWLTEDEARERIPTDKECRSSLPFIRLKSLSTAQPFLLFIKQGALRDAPESGEFSAYGLSSTATIPWF